MRQICKWRHTKIQSEVCKSTCIEFEEATEIKIPMEAAFAVVTQESWCSGHSTSSATPERMEIENTETFSTDRSKQRLLDIRDIKCFKGYKPGGRP